MLLLGGGAMLACGRGMIQPKNGFVGGGASGDSDAGMVEDTGGGSGGPAAGTGGGNGNTGGGAMSSGGSGPGSGGMGGRSTGGSGGTPAGGTGGRSTGGAGGTPTGGAGGTPTGGTGGKPTGGSGGTPTGGTGGVATGGSGGTPTGGTGGMATGGTAGKVIFFDDFSGTSIDTSKWTVYDRISDQVNRELNCCVPANVSVSGGFLNGLSKHEDHTCGDTQQAPVLMHYTSWQIAQKTAPFMYGTVEVRAKLPGGIGIWPTIWMLGYRWQSN
ncbi:MAG TPA: hypothetical protein VN914_16265, partial [Polyangia bacterium]|nr:hypothetical protein [Polyangia bacterium]